MGGVLGLKETINIHGNRENVTCYINTCSKPIEGLVVFKIIGVSVSGYCRRDFLWEIDNNEGALYGIDLASGEIVRKKDIKLAPCKYCLTNCQCKLPIRCCEIYHCQRPNSIGYDCDKECVCRQTNKQKPIVQEAEVEYKVEGPHTMWRLQGVLNLHAKTGWKVKVMTSSETRYTTEYTVILERKVPKSV